MIKREIVLEYLRTIALTLLAVFVAILIMLAVIQHNVYEDQDKKVAKDDVVEYYLVGVLIEKNKYLEEQYPDNYKINLKLGMLYEISKDYKNAEIQYKTAAAKAPYEEFKPKYKLANLFIHANRLSEAQATMDSIIDRPDRQLIEYKANVYYKLGDKYYNSGDYSTAIAKYEKALTYFKVIKSPEIKYVENGIASAYVYLAEEYVSQMKIEDATNALMEANSIVNAPIIKYKLALLLMKSDPDTSDKYFDEVYKKEPSLIDFEGYYKFLNYMAQRALEQGSPSQSELYKIKAKKFMTYYESNVLAIQDISVDYIKGEIVFSRWYKRYNINLAMKLKNSSAQEMKSLFLYIIFKNEGQIIDEYHQQVINADQPLGAGQLSPVINIRTSKAIDSDAVEGGKITAEVFASKSEKSYQLAIAKVNIKMSEDDSKKKSKFQQLLNKIKSLLTGFSHQLP